ncbi:MAG: hypothetical protein QME68_08065, partial [Elusimicrobiota bacterium]|nr:hypothetical protein [Elusimicrobiota bacterium]
ELPLSPLVSAGVDKVFVRIRRTPPGNEYWDNTAWVVNDSTWVICSGTSPWTYPATGLWTDGRIYDINSRAVDFATNLSQWTTATFRWDALLPVVELLKPESEYQKELPTISGTAIDPAPPTGNAYKSGIQTVEVAIQRNPPTGEWWIPTSGWTLGTTYWITATIVGDPDAATPVNWYITGQSTPSWVEGTLYLVKSRVLDRSQNESIHSDRNFYFDTTRPETEITRPQINGDAYGSATKPLATLSGTAGDTDPGQIQKVEIRIERNVPTDKYWNNSLHDWVDFANPDDAFFVTQSSVSNYIIWTATFPTAKWTSGYKYWVNARAFDCAGNYDILYSTKEFVYDTERPEVKPVFPQNNTFIRGLSTISGTSADFPTAGGLIFNAGIYNKWISIRRNSDSLWWNGINLFSEESEVNISLGSGAGDWYYTVLTTAALTSGVSYYITTRAIDYAENSLIWKTFGSTFTFDNTLPISTITYPSAGIYSALTQITGTSNDPLPAAGRLSAGVKEVYLEIHNETPEEDLYWRGPEEGWGAQKWLLCTGTNPWTYT